MKYKLIDYFSKIIRRKRKNKEILFIFCDFENFEKQVDKLFYELFEKKNVDYKDIILEHAGTIFNPISSIKYFPNPYCLGIFRDPRDIYTELKRKAYKFPGYSVEIFCDWYSNIRKKINLDETNHKKVLFLNSIALAWSAILFLCIKIQETG